MMPPHRINIYADRQGVNESLQKWERSKTTELRPSNEDLGKEHCKFIDLASCTCSRSIFPSLFVSQMQTNRAVWALTWGTTLQGYGFSMEHNNYTTDSGMILYTWLREQKLQQGSPSQPYKLSIPDALISDS